MNKQKSRTRYNKALRIAKRIKPKTFDELKATINNAHGYNYIKHNVIVRAFARYEAEQTVEEN